MKPANFVFVKGNLKLIDFGIAKTFSTDTTNIYRESQVGTINYMAPEAIAPRLSCDGSDGMHTFMFIMLLVNVVIMDLFYILIDRDLSSYKFLMYTNKYFSFIYLILFTFLFIIHPC